MKLLSVKWKLFHNL